MNKDIFIIGNSVNYYINSEKENLKNDARAYPYAETFEDEHRMKFYISKMEKYLDSVSDKLFKAVYFMCKAAFVKLFGDDNAAAIKFTRTAQKLVPDVLSGDKGYSQREIFLCYNIYNNLGAFYLDNHEKYNAKKFLEKSQIIYEKYKTPIYELPALINSLEKLEIAEKGLCAY